MYNLSILFNYAGDIDSNWEANEGVDWEQAEMLIEKCQKDIPAELLEKLPTVQSILSYVDENDEWDSGEVAGWPTEIRTELESFDKQYSYREDGENWEVYSLALTGDEEWKATCETEPLAEGIVKFLAPICE
ncbi:hypothetical protein AB4455_06120 [Vibrio sp. 10N.261.46.E12]|uniref:hypothetical protein n=1 Tax=unclassified Vibrio TaxID=2614977 RepID=UPI0009763E2E|nr:MULTISPECIES: hypothetical protein [unclassified Vibrio]OMO34487.1 hypothetical protein BH584_12355 [Vibrio sp. 10N.261.45.E1]PMJ20127.1 hypothetical protein BCU27_20150 [Vibrio sp. 10N.286.45.B6]PML95761.1 hypothetical protein BCT66_22905 [Vibrio sp. 10N.261.49.E11]PMM70896.1 hypothetical protein BCT48_09060 [Vibrio sp. 10N.261.46.F12]PMM88758.1 hypothetical protein BCT46_25380 [Vibrio sp. 10N.261.46.E8]